MGTIVALPENVMRFLIDNNLTVVSTDCSMSTMQAVSKLNDHLKQAVFECGQAAPIAISLQAITSDAIKEADPHGVAQHSPGAKLDAGKVRPSLIFNDMPRALLAVAEVATFGANKYSDGGWQHVPDAAKRYTDAMDRHRLKEFTEGRYDHDSDLTHAAHLAWNALARLELMLRKMETEK